PAGIFICNSQKLIGPRREARDVPWRHMPVRGWVHSGGRLLKEPPGFIRLIQYDQQHTQRSARASLKCEVVGYFPVLFDQLVGNSESIAEALLCLGWSCALHEYPAAPYESLAVFRARSMLAWVCACECLQARHAVVDQSFPFVERQCRHLA